MEFDIDISYQWEVAPAVHVVMKGFSGLHTDNAGST